MSRPSDPDPVAARSAPMARFFARVMRRQLRSQFRALRIARPGLPDLPDDRPVMVVCNHPSWWDPAVMIGLHESLFPTRTGFGPIEAKMLETYPFMRRIGLFGVGEGRRGAQQAKAAGDMGGHQANETDRADQHACRASGQPCRQGVGGCCGTPALPTRSI